MEMNVGLTPVVLLRASAAWAELSNDDRRAWLNAKLAQLQEFQILPNGVFWTDGRSDAAGDVVMMLWNLIDQPAVDALAAMMQQEEVKQYFYVTVHGGVAATDQESIWRPFLRAEP